MIGAKQHIDANVKHIEVLTGKPFVRNIKFVVRNIKFCEILNTVVLFHYRLLDDFLRMCICKPYVSFMRID